MSYPLAGVKNPVTVPAMVNVPFRACEGVQVGGDVAGDRRFRLVLLRRRVGLALRRAAGWRERERQVERGGYEHRGAADHVGGRELSVAVDRHLKLLCAAVRRDHLAVLRVRRIRGRCLCQNGYRRGYERKTDHTFEH